MEERIPPSQPPMQQTLEGQITPEALAEMKARALELAIQQTVPQRPPREVPPQIIYLRRNLTVAEVLLVLLLSCGIVTGIQGLWYLGTNLLPRFEIRVR
jgi:hypothetical protein